MSEITQHTAVLVDPHPLWLQAVRVILRRTGMQVEATTTAPAHALEIVEAVQPDVLITELPGAGDALDTPTYLRRARELAPSLKTVVLSACSDPQQIDIALEAGAVAYVIKTAHPNDITATIRQLFGNSIYFGGVQPAPAPAPAQARPAPENGSAALTRRELEILLLVADGHSNAMLAKRLWVTEQTVKFHLSNIYRKLDVSNRTEASRWAQRQGLLADVHSSVSVA